MDAYRVEQGLPSIQTPGVLDAEMESFTREFDKSNDGTPSYAELLKNVPAGGAKRFTEWFCDKVAHDPRLATSVPGGWVPTQALYYGLPICSVRAGFKKSGTTPEYTAGLEEFSKDIETHTVDYLCPQLK